MKQSKANNETFVSSLKRKKHFYGGKLCFLRSLATLTAVFQTKFLLTLAKAFQGLFQSINKV